MSEIISAEDAIQELRDNKAQMQEFFASKGWELWLKWSDSAKAHYFERAVRLTDAADREEARVKGLALEEFGRLPFFLMEQAESVPAKQAP